MSDQTTSGSKTVKDKMKKQVIVLLSLVSVLSLAGCSTPRWQVHRAAYSSHQAEAPEGDYSSEETLLLDTQTGETWILQPTAEANEKPWEWIKLQIQR